MEWRYSNRMFAEQLQALVAEYPNKSITLLEFCVARNVPREEALSEY
jgi:hypothetical protein